MASVPLVESGILVQSAAGIVFDSDKTRAVCGSAAGCDGSRIGLMPRSRLPLPRGTIWSTF